VRLVPVVPDTHLHDEMDVEFREPERDTSFHYRSRGTGSMTRNVEPWPTALSTRICLPCELIEEKASRFPFRVTCGTCGWMTEPTKLEAVAVKLWNEAKREGKARARPK
jgi:hypothetical protein